MGRTHAGGGIVAKAASFWKLLLVLALMLMACVGMAASPLQADALDDPSGKVVRLDGDNRFDTMQTIVSEGWDSAEVAVIASGENFPDALAASSLCGAFDAPLILTVKGSLPQQAISALEAAGVEMAYVVGGEAAVSPAVVNQLKSMGIVVARVSGPDREATARAIAAETLAHVDSDTCIVAYGLNFADALAVSPLAYVTGHPIYLTGVDGTLSAETQKAITSAGFKNAVIVGGTAVVKQSVESQLKGLDVMRLAGADRFATSVAIADYELSLSSFGSSTMTVATGANFPDALAGAALAGHDRGVLVLAMTGSLDNGAGQRKVSDLASEQAIGVERAYILGGTAAVSDAAAGSLGKVLAQNDVVIDPDAEPVVAYRDGVVQVDSWTLNADGTVTVPASSLPDGVAKGQVLALMPTSSVPDGMTLTVSKVAQNGSKYVLSGSQPDVADVYETLEIQGIADTSNVRIELADGVELVADDSGSSLTTMADYETYDLAEVKFEIDDVSFKLQPSIEYKVDIAWFHVNEAYFAGKIKEEVSYTGKLEKKIEKRLADVSFPTKVPGVFVKVAVWGTISASGELEASFTATQKAGWRYQNGNSSFVHDSREEYSGKIEGEVKAGADVTVSLDALAKPILDASIGGGAKLKCTDLKSRSDGSVCCDIQVGPFLEMKIGAHDSLLRDLGITVTQKLIQKPAGTFHLENWRLVPKCTWLDTANNDTAFRNDGEDKPTPTGNVPKDSSYADVVGKYRAAMARGWTVSSSDPLSLQTLEQYVTDNATAFSDDVVSTANVMYAVTDLGKDGVKDLVIAAVKLDGTYTLMGVYSHDGTTVTDLTGEADGMLGNYPTGKGASIITSDGRLAWLWQDSYDVANAWFYSVQNGHVRLVEDYENINGSYTLNGRSISQQTFETAMNTYKTPLTGLKWAPIMGADGIYTTSDFSMTIPAYWRGRVTVSTSVHNTWVNGEGGSGSHVALTFRDENGEELITVVKGQLGVGDIVIYGTDIEDVGVYAWMLPVDMSYFYGGGQQSFRSISATDCDLLTGGQCTLSDVTNGRVDEVATEWVRTNVAQAVTTP